MGKSSDDNHEEPRLQSIELGPEGDKSIIIFLPENMTVWIE
jgi:hypothetical protein